MPILEHAPISVLIPVRNEAVNLAACIASVAECAEIVVVDSNSSDGTQEIASRAGASVVNFEWNGTFPKKKNWALEHIPWRHDWVFIIDADERATPEMIAAMRSIATDPHPPHAGYYVNRRFWFLDGWLNHCGYFPSWNLRFFRHRLGRYERLADSADTQSGDNEVHEHVVLQGTAGYLPGIMAHVAFPDINTWVEKHNRYSNWEACFQQESAQNSAKGSALGAGLARKRRLRRLAWRMPFRPTLRFLYHYFWRGGFLDGYRGLVFCRLMGWYEFLSVAKGAELQRRRNPSATRPQ